MSETVWTKPAKELGLQLDASPLLGTVYQITLHGMLNNQEVTEIEHSFIVRWKGKQIWRATIWPTFSTHVHYVWRTNERPVISDFTVECRKHPPKPAIRVGLCRFGFDRETYDDYDPWED